MSDPHYDRAPLGYLITFRAHGTWLHGDSRGAVDRFRNHYGTPGIAADARWQRHNENTLNQPPIKLDKLRRDSIDQAIRDTCEIHRWKLWTRNIRTNHVHVVITAFCNPEIALRALKANATRRMKEAGCWNSDQTPWARKGSKRWLWTREQLNAAINYVDNEQGDPLP